MITTVSLLQSLAMKHRTLKNASANAADCRKILLVKI